MVKHKYLFNFNCFSLLSNVLFGLFDYDCTLLSQGIIIHVKRCHYSPSLLGAWYIAIDDICFKDCHPKKKTKTKWLAQLYPFYHLHLSTITQNLKGRKTHTHLFVLSMQFFFLHLPFSLSLPSPLVLPSPSQNWNKLATPLLMVFQWCQFTVQKWNGLNFQWVSI